MKKNFLLSFFLLTGISLFAQEIDISKFVLPEYKRSALEFNLYSSNNGSFTSNRPDSGSLFTENPYASIYNNASVNYSIHSNTKKYQGYVNSSMNVTLPNLSKSWTNTNTSKNENLSRHTNFNLNLSSNNRFYNEAKQYLEISPIISVTNSNSRYFYEYTYDNAASNYSNEYNYNTLNINMEADLRAGVGRVEPVEDLRQTVYIISDLQNAGRLKREPTNDEIMQLAENLALLKNKRFLDSRLRLIEETTEIEKIMKEMDLIAEYDAVYFSTVNDYWSMAGNPSRSAGSRMSFGVKPSIRHNNYSNKTTTIEFSPDTTYSVDYNNIQNGYNVRASAMYEKFRPIDLYWQEDFNVELFSGFQNLKYDYENPINTNNANVLVSGISGNYYLKYYPNSRTSYYGNAGILAEIGKGKEDAYPDGTKHKLFTAQVGAGSTYYFSPQFTISGSAGLSYLGQNNTSSLYSWSGYPIKNTISANLNISLVYKMF